MTRRDLVLGEHDEEWFPPGDPPPATLSPTRPLGRKPAAIPEGLLDRSRPTASGLVRLPGHVAWSPPYEYDLADRRARAVDATIIANTMARYVADLRGETAGAG